MPKGENSKKTAGNAKKAEAAANKKAQADAAVEAAESAKWDKGAKSNKKAEDAAAKKEEAARKKAEKEALAKEEDASLKGPKSQSKGASKKSAAPARGELNLDSLLGEPTSKRGTDLNASGIDNALDALSLTGGGGKNSKIELHPERRFKAAYAAFEERRLEEMADDKSLRRQQKIDQIRKEFEKSPENPFNQALVGRYDMSKEDRQALRDADTASKEARLGRS